MTKSQQWIDLINIKQLLCLCKFYHQSGNSSEVLVLLFRYFIEQQVVQAEHLFCILDSFPNLFHLNTEVMGATMPSKSKRIMEAEVDHEALHKLDDSMEFRMSDYNNQAILQESQVPLPSSFLTNHTRSQYYRKVERMNRSEVVDLGKSSPDKPLDRRSIQKIVTSGSSGQTCQPNNSLRRSPPDMMKSTKYVSHLDRLHSKNNTNQISDKLFQRTVSIRNEYSHQDSENTSRSQIESNRHSSMISQQDQYPSNQSLHQAQFRRGNERCLNTSRSYQPVVSILKSKSPKRIPLSARGHKKVQFDLPQKQLEKQMIQGEGVFRQQQIKNLGRSTIIHSRANAHLINRRNVFTLQH